LLGWRSTRDNGGMGIWSEWHKKWIHNSVGEPHGWFRMKWRNSISIRYISGTWVVKDDRWLQLSQCRVRMWTSDITNVETCVLTLQFYMWKVTTVQLLAGRLEILPRPSKWTMLGRDRRRLFLQFNILQFLPSGLYLSCSVTMLCCTTGLALHFWHDAMCCRRSLANFSFALIGFTFIMLNIEGAGVFW
jgi:hypothetical protein